MALEGSSIMMRILYTGVKKILKKQKKMKKKKKYFENLVKEVKVVAVDFERAIIIADIGGKDVYSTEFRTKMYDPGAQIATGFQMKSIALNKRLYGTDTSYWSQMEQYFGKENNLTGIKKEVPISITGDRTIYSTSDRHQKFYLALLLIAFTPAGTPMINAGEM